MPSGRSSGTGNGRETKVASNLFMNGNYSYFISAILLIVAFFFFGGRSAAATEADREVSSLLEALKGQMILRAEDEGQVYYISPADGDMRFLGRPHRAFRTMKEEGVGITNEDLSRIPPAVFFLTGRDTDGDGLPDKFEDAVGTDPNRSDTSENGYDDRTEISNGYDPLKKEGKLPWDEELARRHAGKIFLQVEGSGEAWYIDPKDNLRYFLGDPADAFLVMKRTARGLSEDVFAKLRGKEADLPKRIEVDLAAQELSYFWGGVEMGAHPVSTGKPATPTSPGRYLISNKADKAWSPLGLWMPYWMGLDSGKIGIHQLPYWPNGYREGEHHLGIPVSHGCIRLGIKPAKEVYEWAEVGTPVLID